MVEFVTLFLGALITGPSPVELRAHADVATVEVRLDARSVATLGGAPWTLEVDFGDELLPHQLEAIGYAADGREIGRTSQWVNLSPKQTEITITLDRDRSRDRVQARLGWQSLSAGGEPVHARALFDGKALEVGDPRIITLPRHDPDRLHHLRVELEFPGPLRAAAEITFGGRYGETVSSGLTAFPVALDGRRELPPIDEMQGWFRSGDRPLRVHAAERGPAEIVVVQSPAGRRQLWAAIRRQADSALPVLDEDHRLRFVGASPALVTRGGRPFVVFPRSSELRSRVGGLRQTLTLLSFADDSSAEVRLSDAVAVAGLFANQSARRRAVVLITTADSNDASQLEPERIRPYLESIGVPLAVWTPVSGMERVGRWGAALDISTDPLLDRAYRELSQALDRQRIVWLSGLYLPQTITLDPGIRGVRALP